ncbi:hypothetical protein HK103_004027 [Boothiomyces macroporosus]|uniref:Thioredoxin domain-containing protein n=1 Tax=Boothiomyces macroporosus TaxID=261099 RepID=A0AAD5ULQ4_9FUNG|nr:hypothetical protein HK103_004027 [Boothiomyces macroporosus]
MADSNLSLAEYNEIIATNPLVFIKVGATWCPPCKVIKPVFHRLGEKYSAKFVSIDVDTSEGNEKFAIEHKVQAYPTFLVFYNGKLIQTLMGAHKKSLEDMVEKMVNSPTDEYIWWGYTCNVCGKENVPGLLKVCAVDEFMVCSECDIPASHPHLKEKFKTCKEPMDVQRVIFYARLPGRLKYIVPIALLVIYFLWK